MRSTPIAARRRPNGSRVPVGFWPSGEDAGERIELVGERDRIAEREAGSASPAPRGR